MPHDHIDIKTSRYLRIHKNSTVIDAKLCGHYINGILASLELQGTHYHEALFLDHENYISEGVGENFFMVKESQIFTPPLGTILAGITRDTIMKLAKKLNFEVIETHITLDETYQADEAFFTGTAAEVTRNYSIDDKVLGKNQGNHVSTKIKKAYLEIVQGKNLDFKDYLTYLV